jgi:DedD protein
VQVGVYVEASAVREARAKVEKLGLPSYTQVIETGSGPRTRVRLGPFGTRDEAEKATAKLKAAGLPGAVLTL